MEEVQLMEWVERYLRGEMNPAERTAFEETRKKNPELDQLVVEQSMFFSQMEAFGEWKNLKASLHEVHGQLAESGAITEKAPRAVVRELWRKYKKVMAVAASIAGFTTLLIASITTYLNRQANQKQLEELSMQVRREVDQKTRGVIHELDRRAPLIPASVHNLSGGTGFLIDGKGYLVTNAHVIKSSVVVQNDKGQEFSAEVVYTDHKVDLAILRINDSSFKAYSSLPYSISKNLVDLGEPLFTLGYPRNEVVYNEGYMSAKTGYNGDTLTCQIGVTANPGNSGGPVFNKNGEVIGIINTRQLEAEGVVFAINSKNIFRALEDIRANDSTAPLIKLPVSSSLRGMERTQQIKKIEDCVFMIRSY